MIDLFEEYVEDILFEDEDLMVGMESGVDNIVLEGANLDSRKKYKACVKKHKKLFKEIKKNVKKENYSNAKKLLKEADKNIDECIKIVKTYKDMSGVGSFIFSYFVGNIPTLGRTILMSLIPFVGSPAAAIVNLVENISAICRNVIENKDKISISDFNIYQNKLITKLMMLKKAIKKYESLIKEAEKNQK